MVNWLDSMEYPLRIEFSAIDGRLINTDNQSTGAWHSHKLVLFLARKMFALSFTEHVKFHALGKIRLKRTLNSKKPGREWSIVASAGKWNESSLAVVGDSDR
jgi:hypothetical protein